MLNPHAGGCWTRYLLKAPSHSMILWGSGTGGGKNQLFPSVMRAHKAMKALTSILEPIFTSWWCRAVGTQGLIAWLWRTNSFCFLWSKSETWKKIMPKSKMWCRILKTKTSRGGDFSGTFSCAAAKSIQLLHYVSRLQGAEESESPFFPIIESSRGRKGIRTALSHLLSVGWLWQNALWLQMAPVSYFGCLDNFDALWSSSKPAAFTETLSWLHQKSQFWDVSNHPSPS